MIGIVSILAIQKKNQNREAHGLELVTTAATYIPLVKAVTLHI